MGFQRNLRKVQGERMARGKSPSVGANRLVFSILSICVLVKLATSTPYAGYDPSFYLQFPPVQYNHLGYNGIGPSIQHLPPWIHQHPQVPQNQSISNNNPNPNPARAMQLPPTEQQLRLVNQQRVNPPPQPQQLQNNGTIVYYLQGPWGGIRTVVPVNRNVENHNMINTTPQNWQYPNQAPGVSPPALQFGNFDREQQTQTTPPNQGNNNMNNYLWNQPLPNNFGWGWGWNSVYNGPSLTTGMPTGAMPMQGGDAGSGTTVTRQRPSTPTTTEVNTTPPSTEEITVNLADADSNSTDAPGTSDAVAKFRRIVYQIREITRKELRA